MRHWRQLLGMSVLLGIGYVCGTLQLVRLPVVFAQDATGGASEDAVKKIQTAYDQLKAARDTLEQEGLYKSVTKGLNTYAVLAGGIDSVRDLEDGKGVDPETWAALYAGEATEEIEPNLSRDDEGRMTYKGKPLRIYSISRMKRIHAQRQVLTGEVQPTRAR